MVALPKAFEEENSLLPWIPVVSAMASSAVHRRIRALDGRYRAVDEPVGDGGFVRVWQQASTGGDGSQVDVSRFNKVVRWVVIIV